VIKNYFKTAWRNLVKHGSFSIINIMGLAISMSLCLLIIMIIADQLSYDRFQPNRNRIYRIETLGKNGSLMRPTASSPLPLASTLKSNFAGIEQSAALARDIGGDVFYNDRVASGGGYFADGNILQIMNFQLLEGNPATVLNNPFSMVISESMANTLFPREEAVGKIIRFNNTGINPGGPEGGNRETPYGNFLITGVLKPNPGKTSLPFSFLASLSTLKPLAKDSILNHASNDWNNVWSNYTYVLLGKGKSKADLQRMLDQVSEKQYPKGNSNQYTFRAIALPEIPLSGAQGNRTTLFIPKIVLIVLSILSLIVMLSACLNYTNLSVARLLTRSKEVGVRKVHGASRRQVFVQFIGEAMLVSLLALVCAVVLLFLLQHLFSGLWFNQYLNITFHQNIYLYLIFLGFSILVGLVAGILPSIYISRINPVSIFRNVNGFKFFRRLTLRKILLVIQFCVSLVFIISALLILSQTRHVLNFDYGFHQNDIINIKLMKPDNYNRFAQAVRSNKDIRVIGAASLLPATGHQNGTMVYRSEHPADSLPASYMDINAQAKEVWELKLLAGKNLPEIPSKAGDDYVLVNEKMLEVFHFATPVQAIGQRLLIEGHNPEIIGVVKDFQFLDVTRPIEPLVIRNRASEFNYATVRYNNVSPAAMVAFLKETWNKVNPGTKFEYEFYDQELLTAHSLLSDVVAIVAVLAFLAVFISCLGLLGMVTYTAETKQKEIGIRKVFGSGTMSIMLLVSREFLVLLVIAITIGLPLAFIINGMWLRFFPSRVSIGLPVLLSGVSILAILCVLAVFSQGWRASRVNPIESLRNE
jgi:putative ABC transport system permease protein